MDDPGGGFHWSPPGVEEDPYHATRGSLWYDDVFGLADSDEPVCHDLENRDHHPGEATWCILGEEPDSSYWAIIEDAVEEILQRCPDLSSAWNNVKQGVRLWHHGGEEYGGVTRSGEKWLLISYGWIDADPELGLAHELVHHVIPPVGEVLHPPAFVEKEKECSGGRSAVQ